MGKIFMMYIVGMSGSGKTTIANALEKELKKRGAEKLQIIDGDIIREQFGGIFGYTHEERMKCNQVVRVVIDYLIRNGISVILTQVAAYEEMRQKMREQFEEKYIEVYVKCSYEECARRDVKGYYHKQQREELRYLNGADDIYEVPQNSQVVVDTEKESIEESVQKVLLYLKENHYVI